MERTRVDGGCLRCVLRSSIGYDDGRGETVSAVHSNASQSRRLCRVLGTDAIARLCADPFKPTDQGGLDPEELIPPFRI